VTVDEFRSSFFLEVTLHALLNFLLTLIREVVLQFPSPIETHAHVGAVQEIEASTAGAGDDDDDDDDGPARRQLDEEDDEPSDADMTCERRTFALALYELSTDESIPISRTNRAMDVWTAVTQETAVAYTYTELRRARLKPALPRVPCSSTRQPRSCRCSGHPATTSSS
jgi:hypothetical protein